MRLNQTRLQRIVVRFEDGNWRYYVVKMETLNEYDTRQAINRFYEQPDETIYRCKPTGEHKEVQIQDGDRRASVDELIAPLILECWKCGWDTIGSCQLRPSGKAYISFPFPSHGEAFASAARTAGIDVETQPKTLTLSTKDDPPKKKSVETLHVIFAPDQIDSLANAVSASRNSLEK